jgi:predicted nucleic acid-binding protein
MITAIDTSVLLDVFLPDKKHLESSSKLLRRAYDVGALVICHLVYAELVPQFIEKKKLDAALFQLNAQISSLVDDVDFLAGTKWLEYRSAGGSRERIISDFIIGAHAMLRADRFLTRDRGFYKTYFPDLELMHD